MRTVICDADPTLRGVVSSVSERLGHTVIAETENPLDAVELATRFGAELVIIDVALPYGTGKQALELLKQRGSTAHVVIFGSEIDDERDLMLAGARAVVTKPDFERLEAVLTELLADPDAPVEVERRRAATSRAVAPVGDVSFSGLEWPSSFGSVVAALEEGDAVLVVHIASDVSGDGAFGELAAADRLLALARISRSMLRTQDRLSVNGDGDLMLVLLGGSHPGIEAVFERIVDAQQRSGLIGVVSGGWAVRDDIEPGTVTAGRAEGAARRSLSRPVGDRLWAG